MHEESTPITLTQVHSFSKLYIYFYFIAIWTAESLAIVTALEVYTLHLCVCVCVSIPPAWLPLHVLEDPPSCHFQQRSKLKYLSQGLPKSIMSWHSHPGRVGDVTQAGGLNTKLWTAKNRWYLSANSQQSFVKLSGWPALPSCHCSLFQFIFVSLTLFSSKNYWGQVFSWAWLYWHKQYSADLCLLRTVPGPTKIGLFFSWVSIT